MPRHPDAASGSAGFQVCFDKLATALVVEGRAVLHDVLPPEHLDALRRRVVALDTQGVLAPAATGRGEGRHLNARVRSDGIHWLRAEEPVDRLWLDYAEGLRQALNERLFLGLFDFEAHYARYAPGDFYSRHRDAFAGQRNRVVSTVLYLNETWQADDGGELLLYDDSGEKLLDRLLPQGNSLVVFLSERVPHEVLPAQRARYSVAGWFRLRN